MSARTVIVTAAALLAALTTTLPLRAHQEHAMEPADKPLPREVRREGNPVPANERSLSAGEQVFSTYCATCHGARGRGNGPAADGLERQPRNLHEVARRLRDTQIAAHVRQGGPVMPPFGDVLESRQVWHVVNYVQRLGR